MICIVSGKTGELAGAGNDDNAELVGAALHAGMVLQDEGADVAEK